MTEEYQQFLETYGHLLPINCFFGRPIRQKVEVNPKDEKIIFKSFIEVEKYNTRYYDTQAFYKPIKNV